MDFLDRLASTNNSKNDLEEGLNLNDYFWNKGKMEISKNDNIKIEDVIDKVIKGDNTDHKHEATN